MAAWNGWYHVDCHTYGTWLPGDPRGWRDKKHRTHCEGDYKNLPPEDSGSGHHRHAQSLLKRAPSRLQPAFYPIAGQALVEMLVDQDIELLALAIESVHFHLLGRFDDSAVRRSVGRAKKHAYFELRDKGCPDVTWEKKSGVTQITSRGHQVNVYRYILRHADQGAWVWNFREGIYWRAGEEA